MPRYEYKVVPAPEKARKVRGLKGAARFANAVEELMNDLAAEGWTYVRADTLPHEERAGLTSKTVTYRNLLVFQRALEEAEASEEAEPEATSAPATAEETPSEVPEDSDADTTPEQAETPPTREAPLLRALRASDDDTASPNVDAPKPLFPNRQSQRVDL